jgi:hypothetical protein
MMLVMRLIVAESFENQNIINFPFCRAHFPQIKGTDTWQ